MTGPDTARATHVVGLAPLEPSDEEVRPPANRARYQAPTDEQWTRMTGADRFRLVPCWIDTQTAVLGRAHPRAHAALEGLRQTVRDVDARFQAIVARLSAEIAAGREGHEEQRVIPLSSGATAIAKVHTMDADAQMAWIRDRLPAEVSGIAERTAEAIRDVRREAPILVAASFPADTPWFSSHMLLEFSRGEDGRIELRIYDSAPSDWRTGSASIAAGHERDKKVSQIALLRRALARKVPLDQSAAQVYAALGNEASGADRVRVVRGFCLAEAPGSDALGTLLCGGRMDSDVSGFRSRVGAALVAMTTGATEIEIPDDMAYGARPHPHQRFLRAGRQWTKAHIGRTEARQAKLQHLAREYRDKRTQVEGAEKSLPKGQRARVPKAVAARRELLAELHACNQVVAAWGQKWENQGRRLSQGDHADFVAAQSKQVEVGRRLDETVLQEPNVEAFASAVSGRETMEAINELWLRTRLKADALWGDDTLLDADELARRVLEQPPVPEWMVGEPQSPKGPGSDQKGAVEEDEIPAKSDSVGAAAEHVTAAALRPLSPVQPAARSQTVQATASADTPSDEDDEAWILVGASRKLRVRFAQHLRSPALATIYAAGYAWLRAEPTEHGVICWWPEGQGDDVLDGVHISVSPWDTRTRVSRSGALHDKGPTFHISEPHAADRGYAHVTFSAESGQALSRKSPVFEGKEREILKNKARGRTVASLRSLPAEVAAALMPPS